MVNTPAASSEDTNNLRFMEHLSLGSGPERDPNVLPKLEHHFKGGGLPCQCHACLPKQTMVLTLGSIVGKPFRRTSRMPAVMSDVVQLHCGHGNPLIRAEGMEQGGFQFRRVGRYGLKRAPPYPLPCGECADLHGQHLGSTPGREIATCHFPGAAQPVVTAFAAQGAVPPGQAQAALERERAAVRQEGAETFAEPVEILSADLAARYSLSALELLLQQRGVDCTIRTFRGDRKDGNAISSHCAHLLFVTHFARAAPIRERRGSSCLLRKLRSPMARRHLTKGRQDARYTRLSSRARTIASVLLRTCNLPKMLFKCHRIVPTPISSSLAIS